MKLFNLIKIYSEGKRKIDDELSQVLAKVEETSNYLKSEMGSLRTEMERQTAQLRIEMERQTAQLRIDLQGLRIQNESEISRMNRNQYPFKMEASCYYNCGEKQHELFSDEDYGL